jgi:mono/diheme cytochrome c family protein
MKRRSLAVLSLILTVTFLSGAAARAGGDDAPGGAGPVAAPPVADAVARGGYLVQFGSCHDCHTPFKMGSNGPEPDMTRALSGHPSAFVVPPPPPPSDPWIWFGVGTNTAFAGPWGVSFTANLTPDKDTGLGNWTEDMFLMALRTGRHEGKGRPILPPMPYKFVGSLSDEDLKAVFAYLQSIPPIRNRVPAPIDPPEETER